MSTALLEAPIRAFAAQAADGRRPTLAELLDATWRQATTHGTADCPICHAEMRATGGAADAAARCTGCGTTLA
jgi:hypothetical protein